MTDATATDAPADDPANPHNYRYCGFNDRIVASLIDLTLSTLVILPFFTTEPPERVQEIMQLLQTGAMSTNQAVIEFRQYYLVEGGLEESIMNSAIQFVLLGGLIILFWLKRGATPGKAIMQIKIVDFKTGERPKPLQSLIRYIGYIPAFPTFFWMAIDKKRQGIHDKIGGTVVIYTGQAASWKYKLSVALFLAASIGWIYIDA